ncbi:hypothetical protein Pelo_7839 [Pelomyxa schiedti]|nr:hypothetical protein Pelo_7839 [Pelomyxa schiedti]
MSGGRAAVNVRHFRIGASEYVSSAAQSPVVIDGRPFVVYFPWMLDIQRLISRHEQSEVRNEGEAAVKPEASTCVSSADPVETIVELSSEEFEVIASKLLDNDDFVISITILADEILPQLDTLTVGHMLRVCAVWRRVAQRNRFWVSRVETLRQIHTKAEPATYTDPPNPPEFYWYQQWLNLISTARPGIWKIQKRGVAKTLFISKRRPRLQLTPAPYYWVNKIDSYHSCPWCNTKMKIFQHIEAVENESIQEVCPGCSCALVTCFTHSNGKERTPKWESIGFDPAANEKGDKISSHY